MKYDSKTTSITLIMAKNRFERVETVETRLKLEIRAERAAGTQTELRGYFHHKLTRGRTRVSHDSAPASGRGAS